MKLTNLAALYDYFDNLVLQDCSNDDLFASSYLRGFITLTAADFGDEQQLLTKALASKVSEKLQAARNELSPGDRALIQNYWLELQQAFSD